MPRASVGSSTSIVRVVSIPPSHLRNTRSPILRATSSIHDTHTSLPSSGICSWRLLLEGASQHPSSKMCVEIRFQTDGEGGSEVARV